jgi:hypothetical protein
MMGIKEREFRPLPGNLSLEANTAGLEVAQLAIVLHERRRVVEVARVAELRGQRALAGVVALVSDVEAQRYVTALG